MQKKSDFDYFSLATNRRFWSILHGFALNCFRQQSIYLATSYIKELVRL